MVEEDIVYDIECYKNFFLVVCKRLNLPGFLAFEISPRRNDGASLFSTLKTFKRMIGFNNLHYDYVLLHHFFNSWEKEFCKCSGEEIAGQLKLLSNEIIENSDNIFDSNKNRKGPDLYIPEKYHIIPQIDLLKIHHFDNINKRTSLKALEFNMRWHNLEDLPIAPDAILTPEQMDIIVKYCANDVGATEKFAIHSQDAIKLREELGPKWMNYNDAKIGKVFFKDELEKACPGITRGPTTVVSTVNFGDIIFPWIQFQREPFQRSLARMKDTTIRASDIKSSFDGIDFFHRDFVFTLGSGGLHGSAPKGIYAEDEECEVLDIDVISYYPSIAIKNRLHPKHLGNTYCEVNERLLIRRKSYKKGTSLNKTLKLALNGSWGDSGNKHGIFYDVSFLLSVSVNGQLLLCLLAETLMEQPEVKIIQANTDGLTLKFPRRLRPWVESVCKWWEQGTQLELEYVNYKSIWIRDVNNYAALGKDGKIKTKGAYVYENLEWNKNWSHLVIPRVAVQTLINGNDVQNIHRRLQFEALRDPWSFLIIGKAPRGSRLMWGDEQIQRISRYYVSTTGRQITKIMPPKAGGVDERRISQQKGQTVRIANVYNGEPLQDINFDWYAKEVKKLIVR